MSDSPPTKLSVHYQNAPNKVSFPVSGVHGGLNFQGQLIAHFFTEARGYPSTTKVTIDHQQHIVREEQTSSVDGGIVMVREVQASVFFDARMAELLGTWLLEHAKTMNERKLDQRVVVIPTQSKP
ncbi:MAG: hypothetical protein Q7S40_06380 [Opitutaceae bacterium]|nr:hypothetical protein [Opitutaceae bacterium]